MQRSHDITGGTPMKCEEVKSGHSLVVALYKFVQELDVSTINLKV